MNPDNQTLWDEIKRGEFRPTRAQPNGTGCWLVFGTPGDDGTPTANGPRRIIYCLTTEIETHLPALTHEALVRCGARDPFDEEVAWRRRVNAN